MLAMAWRGLFFICLSLSSQIQGQIPNPAGVTDSGKNILEHCLKNALNFFTEKVGMVTDVNEADKKILTKMIMNTFKEIQEDEERAQKVKFIKRRVQFTNITDAISLNQRVSTQMNTTIVDFKNKTSISVSFIIKR